VGGAQLHLWGLPHSPLLQQGLSVTALEAAQAGVQGTGSSSSSSRRQRGPDLNSC